MAFEKDPIKIFERLKIIEPTEEERLREEKVKKLKDTIKIKRSNLYVELDKTLCLLRHTKLGRHLDELNIKYNTCLKELKTDSFKETIVLYELMNNDFDGIEIKIAALINSLDESKLSTDYPYSVSHYLLALNLRSIIEESAQIRYIFYTGDIWNLPPLNLDTYTDAHITLGDYNLKSVSDATKLMRKKSIFLEAVEKNPYANLMGIYWLNDEIPKLAHIGDLLYKTLPKNYKKLYSKLCKYSHNSKLVTYLEDDIKLLDEIEILILPLLKEFNYIYNIYFADVIEKLDELENKKSL